MQVQLDIPEPLYAEYAQAAAASGQSIEAVLLDKIADAHADELPASFWTPERMAEMEAAQAEIEAGDFFTPEQVRAHFAAKRAAWAQSQQP